MQVETTEKF